MPDLGKILIPLVILYGIIIIGFHQFGEKTLYHLHQWIGLVFDNNITHFHRD